MKLRKNIGSPGCAFLLAVFIAGCAAGNQSHVQPEPSPPNGPAAIAYCPDRLQRAKTGGLVGGIFGLLAGGLTGSVVIASVYKVAGYVAGFTSAQNCTERGFVIERVGPVEASEPLPSREPIHEETLTNNARP